MEEGGVKTGGIYEICEECGICDLHSEAYKNTLLLMTGCCHLADSLIISFLLLLAGFSINNTCLHSCWCRFSAKHRVEPDR